MEAAVEEALARIDMRTHEGQHPRVGAVDVIPFVPLGETTMDECVALARAFGERIAARFDLPVYLYARAAQRPEREVLADIRTPAVRGPARADLDARLHARLWAGAPASHRRRGRRRCAAIPDRLQHQPREPRPGPGQGDRQARARANRWAAARSGTWAVPRRSELRPGVDEPARLLASRPCGECGRRSATRPPSAAWRCASRS